MAITTVHNELIAVNAISGTAIADNAVTSVHIAKNNIGTVQIAQNSVTSVSIAENNVTINPIKVISYKLFNSSNFNIFFKKRTPLPYIIKKNKKK